MHVLKMFFFVLFYSCPESSAYSVVSECLKIFHQQEEKRTDRNFLGQVF